MMNVLHSGHAGSSLLRTVKALCVRLTLLGIILLSQACATSLALSSARDQFRHGNAEGALQTLNEADVSRRNQLLLLLDTGLVAQAAGEYGQSIKAFEKAYQLIDQLQYLSVRDQSAAMVSSDWALRYSAEFSERLWIHTFQMINYLMLDKPSGAAVEARRAVALYDKHNDILEHDLFTRYLMALSFEAAGQSDSAAVEYRKLAGMVDANESRQMHSSGNELVLLIATGFIAPKLPGDLLIDINARISFPYYPDIHERLPDIQISDGAANLEFVRVDTRLLPIARSALAKRGKAIAARQAIRLATKYSLIQSIEDQDPLAGGIARLFMLAIEQADTRSWETLPAHLSLLRVEVPKNASSVNISIDQTGDSSLLYQSHNIQLNLNEKKTQFHMIRVGIETGAELLVHP